MSTQEYTHRITRREEVPFDSYPQDLAINETEFFCRSCNRRCTVSPDGKTEYGHGYHCPHGLHKKRGARE